VGSVADKVEAVLLVESKDGTPIAYERRGSGPVVILVDGALCSRTFGPTPKLAPVLAERFTVVSYDRRGRGKSGDREPYSIDREIEDLAALIEASGGSAFLYGASSGAVLALRAAARGIGVAKLAMYDPPFVTAGAPAPVPPDRVREIIEHARAGRRSDAVKTFLRMVGTPAMAIPIMRIIPGVWSNLTAVAHTLPYDLAMLGDYGADKPVPADVAEALAAVRVPTLVGVGAKSPGWMQHTVDVVARGVPGARREVLAGQNHVVSEKAIGPVLVEFFSSEVAS
jgi:pimeloyl-ACP methyl ester carboxylesterase